MPPRSGQRRARPLPCPAGAGEHQRELVPAEAAEDVVRRAQRVADPVGQRSEQPVAGLVPEGVVDLLELVEVHHQQRSRVLSIRHGDQLCRARVESAAVGQTRQLVRRGKALCGHHPRRLGDRGGQPEEHAEERGGRHRDGGRGHRVPGRPHQDTAGDQEARPRGHQQDEQQIADGVRGRDDDRQAGAVDRGADGIDVPGAEGGTDGQRGDESVEPHAAREPVQPVADQDCHRGVPGQVDGEVERVGDGRPRLRVERHDLEPAPPTTIKIVWSAPVPISAMNPCRTSGRSASKGKRGRCTTPRRALADAGCPIPGDRPDAARGEVSAGTPCVRRVSRAAGPRR